MFCSFCAMYKLPIDEKNNLDFKRNFYFQTLFNIFILTPLTPEVQRLVIHDESNTILMWIFAKLCSSLVMSS